MGEEGLKHSGSGSGGQRGGSGGQRGGGGATFSFGEGGGFPGGGEGFEFNMNDAFNMFKSFFGGSGGDMGDAEIHFEGTGMGGMGGGMPGMGGRGQRRAREGRGRRAAQPTPPLFVSSDDVIVLNARNFKSHVGRQARGVTRWLLAFHKQNQASKALAETLKKVGKGLKGIVRIGAVDCSAHKAVCSGQDVRSVPSVRILGPTGSEAYTGSLSGKAIRDALVASLPDTVTVSHFVRGVHSFKVMSKAGRLDAGAVLLFTAHEEPRPLLKSIAGRYPLPGPKPKPGIIAAFHPRFMQIEVPIGEDIHAESLATLLGVTELPALLAFRPAVNTSAATELHNLHLEHGVMSRYSGKPGDANAIRRWLKATGKSWESAVVAASRRAAKQIATALRTEAAEVAAKQSKRKAAQAAAKSSGHGGDFTPSIASMLHLLQCLDPLAPASPGAEGPQGQRACVLLLGTTVAAASQFATSKNQIAAALSDAAAEVPKLAHLRVMRLDVPSVIAQRWKAGTPQAHLALATIALLTGGRGAAKDAYMETVNATVVKAATAAVHALGGGGTDEQAFAGMFGRMAAAAAVASAQTFVMEFTSMLTRWSGEIAPRMPAVVVFQTDPQGLIQVTPVLGRVLGEAIQRFSAPEVGSFATKMPQKEARGAAVAEAVLGAVRGDLPSLKVPQTLANAVVGMLQARVAAEKD